MAKSVKPLIFLELNEVNFDYVSYYIDCGFLSNFSLLIKEHGLVRTESEKLYHELEPWIQWPSVRTGKSFSEHGIFRLGDMEASSIDQHWEILESHGFSVAAISPINGSNKTVNSPFWISDPWVDTKVSGSSFIKDLSLAVSQAVNDNAKEKLSRKSAFTILNAVIKMGSFSSYPTYLKLLSGVLKKQHWSKAAILDRLLSDVFIYLWKKNIPDFSVLFLNAGAHIQHHYLLNSPFSNANFKNPSWYVQEGQDPLLDILKIYDKILGDLITLDARLLVATGLKQVIYESPVYYWRLKNHAAFLQKLNIDFLNVSPRMTRDFLIEFRDSDSALKAEEKLKSLCDINKIKLFDHVDNRGDSLFVTLTYYKEISFGMSVFSHGRNIDIDISNEVVFVALKNGHHHEEGYYIDSNYISSEVPEKIKLTDLFYVVMEHFSVSAK